MASTESHSLLARPKFSEPTRVLIVIAPYYRDIADGLLAGAVQYWLYSRQPCADPECEECVPISTAEGRIEELRRLMRQFAEESEYFHSPTDRNVGRA